MIGNAIYVLCALTSLACAVLLGRAYVASKARILMLSAIAFALFFVNNAFVVLDFIVLPNTNLHVARSAFGFLAAAVLALGLAAEVSRD
mgnify:CR=1 FL=1